MKSSWFFTIIKAVFNRKGDKMSFYFSVVSSDIERRESKKKVDEVLEDLYDDLMRWSRLYVRLDKRHVCFYAN